MTERARFKSIARIFHPQRVGQSAEKGKEERGKGKGSKVKG